MGVNLASRLLLRTSFTSRLWPGLLILDTFQLAGGSFFFGIAVLWTYLLALLSVRRLQQALGSNGWWFLRVVGLNYIAYAFASDFLRYPQLGSIKYLVGYLPFAVLSVLGPLLCLAAFGRRIAQNLLRSS